MGSRILLRALHLLFILDSSFRVIYPWLLQAASSQIQLMVFLRAASPAFCGGFVGWPKQGVGVRVSPKNNHNRNPNRFTDMGSRILLRALHLLFILDSSFRVIYPWLLQAASSQIQLMVFLRAASPAFCGGFVGWPRQGVGVRVSPKNNHNPNLNRFADIGSSILTPSCLGAFVAKNAWISGRLHLSCELVLCHAKASN